MDTIDWEDTIVGIATARGSGIRTIIRVTGQQSHESMRSLLGEGDRLPWNRIFSQTIPLTMETWNRTIEVRLASWPAGRSYTGQPTVELLLPVCCSPLTDAIQNQLFRHGIRLAKPGEFTLRAFLAGRLDLAQAEGVLGLIEAENLDQLKQAIDQRAGGISQPIVVIRSELLDLLADVEAGLDFVEEDIQFISSEDLYLRLSQLHERLEQLVKTLASRSLSSAIPKVVLLGLPNAGKSSLLNALAQREHALVSPMAGTTRDYVSAILEHKTIRFELIDTAGIEMAVDSITDQAQQQRAMQFIHADLALLCVPFGDTSPLPMDAKTLLIRTKADTSDNRDDPDCAGFVSVHDPASVDRLREIIAGRLSHLTSDRSPSSHDATSFVSVSQRCRESIERGSQALEECLDLVRRQSGQEYVAVTIREALSSLGEIVGAVYTDDLLDKIFSKFCIGK